jgi:hypothetical protein
MTHDVIALQLSMTCCALRGPAVQAYADVLGHRFIEHYDKSCLLYERAAVHVITQAASVGRGRVDAADLQLLHGCLDALVGACSARREANATAAYTLATSVLAAARQPELRSCRAADAGSDAAGSQGACSVGGDGRTMPAAATPPAPRQQVRAPACTKARSLVYHALLDALLANEPPADFKLTMYT